MPKKLKPQSQPLFKRIWQNSQTVFLSKLQAASGAISLVLVEMNGMFNDTTVQNYLNSLSPPKWVPVALLILAAITYVAHGHKDNNA